MAEEERTGSRPGDVARAALRHARTAKAVTATPEAAPEALPSSAPRPDAPGAAGGEAARPAGTTRPARPTATGVSTPSASADPSADGAGSRPADAAREARPADGAREALRAARRQARVDSALKGAASSHRPPRPARGPHGTGGSPAAARARAVRDFAAEAFRLPPDVDPAGTAEPAAEPQLSEPLPGEPLSSGEPTGGPAESAETSPPAEPRAPEPTSSEPTFSEPPAAATPLHEPPRPQVSAAAHPERAPKGSEPALWRPSYQAPHGTPSRGPHEDPLPTPPSVPPVRTAPSTAAANRHDPGAPTPPGAPTAPRTPRSMAAPGRDGELRRTFPALPPIPAEGGDFAGTWWGNAWVTALEEGALDAARLARGRRYAERGHVDAITVTPGLVLAYVQGSRPRPYRVQVRLRTLDDAGWERFLDAAVERPGHIAALLDKELPHSLADCGVPLLPGPGDLAPQCSCPDSGHPCKHAAALCYQTARLLDADPFVLLLLRGRGERELLDALSRLNAARAARAAQDRGPAPLPGVRAAAALAERTLPPLPAPLPAPPHPEQPPAYPAAPGGPDPFALDQLATDAAARAHALLTTGRDPIGGLTLWRDAVRLAAARPGSGLTAGTRALYASLAQAAGRGTAELARAVAAWRQGGPDGLDVLEEPWDPPAGRFDRARPLLLAADLPAFRPWRNHLTHPRGHVQLRLGRTGLWYAYESEPGRDDWWPRGTPDLDPVGALTGLGGAGDL
ncbi:SWIM zinc finger family protein [Streptomyces sp. NPDC056568]|uniref:SWIM zinc finger family protein n=1 Tax=Streptomyces sp. NPDC056568 TaxID=3345866 RepID=UPI003680793D